MKKLEKEFTQITDDQEVYNLLNNLLKTKARLWIWKESSDSKKYKIVSYCLLKNIDKIKKICELGPIHSENFIFKNEDDVYLYSQKTKVFIKLDLFECNKSLVSFKFPLTLDIVKKEFIDKKNLIEKEDESGNMYKRYTPRKKIKDLKLTGFYKQVDEQGVLGYYPLGDVSSGGLCFFINDPSEFEIDEVLNIISVGERDFNKPVSAIVRGIRQVDDEAGEVKFKVGVQFLKG